LIMPHPLLYLVAVSFMSHHQILVGNLSLILGARIELRPRLMLLLMKVTGLTNSYKSTLKSPTLLPHFRRVTSTWCLAQWSLELLSSWACFRLFYYHMLLEVSRWQEGLWTLLCLLPSLVFCWSVWNWRSSEIPPWDPWKERCSSSCHLSCSCLDWQRNRLRLLCPLRVKELETMGSSRMATPKKTYLLPIAYPHKWFNPCWFHNGKNIKSSSYKTQRPSWKRSEEHSSRRWFWYR